MLLIGDAHMFRIASRVQTSFASLFVTEVLLRASPSRILFHLMQIPENLTNALAHLLFLKSIKALLTLDITDCNCTLSIQGHCQFWSLHEHRPLDQPW